MTLSTPPQGERPASDRPPGDRPASDRPAGDRPASDRPAAAEQSLAGSAPRVIPTELSAGWLHLRPWRSGDEPAALAAGADPDVVRWTSIPQPYTDETATAYVSRETADGWAAGDSLTWAVCRSTTGEVLADIALRRQADPAVWDIGFWCLPAARGQGVVPSAIGVVCRWAFAELGAARIEWRAFVGNTASRRAAEKAGFRFEGTSRSALVHRGRRVDCWVAALLPPDLR